MDRGVRTLKPTSTCKELAKFNAPRSRNQSTYPTPPALVLHSIAEKAEFAALNSSTRVCRSVPVVVPSMRVIETGKTFWIMSSIRVLCEKMRVLCPSASSFSTRSTRWDRFRSNWVSRLNVSRQARARPRDKRHHLPRSLNLVNWSLRR